MLNGLNYQANSNSVRIGFAMPYATYHEPIPARAGKKSGPLCPPFLFGAKAQYVSSCKSVIASARAPSPMPKAPRAMPAGTKPPAATRKAIHTTNSVSFNMDWMIGHEHKNEVEFRVRETDDGLAPLAAKLDKVDQATDDLGKSAVLQTAKLNGHDPYEYL